MNNNLEFKCPLCSTWIALKPMKNGKPHGFCRSCGLELFFRLESTVKALEISLKSKSGLVRGKE
jgi:hypothetical protein